MDLKDIHTYIWKQKMKALIGTYGHGMDMEWIWNGNVNAMIYDKYKVDITFVHRMDMYKH